MSGAQTPTLGPAQSNALFNPLAVQKAQGVQNQLLQQQQTISEENMAQVGRAAAGLLSAYPDEASRAAAYPPVVGLLQSLGYAKNAPAQYPGEATLRAIVAASVPATEQFKLQQTKAALDAVWPNAPASTTGTPTTGAAAPATTGTVAPSGPAPFVGANLPAGVSPDEDQLVRTVFGEARGEPVAGQQAVASVIKTRMGLGKQGVGDVVFAPNQFEAWSDPKNRPGMEALDPSSPQYQSILNNVVRPVMSGQAQDPTGGATNFYNPTLQAQLGRSTPGFAQGNQTTIGNHTFFYGGYAPRGAATAAAQPAAAPAGGGGTPAPYQTASNAPTAPPGSTAAPAPASPAPDTPWDLPGAPAPDLPPPSTPTAAPATAASTAPAQPAPAAGSPPAIPGRTPPPAPTVTVPPPVPLPPAPPPVDGRYLTAQDYQDLNRMKAGLVTNPNGAQLLQAEIDRRATTNVQRIQNYQAAQEKQRADAIAAQQLQLQGGDAARKTWQAANPPPTTPRFGEGSAVWNADTKQWDTVTGNNMANAVQGHWAVNNTGQQQFFPISPAATQAQSEAKAAGTAAGTATGKLTSELADQGRASAQAIGNIDYGLSQLDKAKAGGINTGYFAPWLSTIGAVAKSLGVPTEAIGVDPKAVGNIQTAQKTLAVVSGAILQQVLGPDSQITDAKLQHFIHAQPGIETDPEAVSRVLNWARSQFVYEREQAAQGMKDASASGGVLPANWQASYYDKHGFAPIYNPGTGEMQQPDGSAPPRQPPASVVTAPVNPSARTAGTTYSTPKGPMKWTGTGWVSP